MPKSGSIAIALAVFSRRGLLLLATGLVVLLASAAIHATHAHLAAALLFGVAMAAVRILARYDENVLGTPWSIVIRVTDVLSLVALAVATFGPLLIVATGGHPGWDIVVLAGVLAIWWVVLDALVADYRRVRFALLVAGAAWLPVVLLHPTAPQIAHAVAAMTAVAIALTVWGMRRAMSGVPRHYRVIDVGSDD